MKVYAVGCMRLDETPNARRLIRDQRLWSLYASLEEAQEAVLNNRGDLFEYSYNYALIEEVHVINKVTGPAHQTYELTSEWWYKADYSKANEDNDFNPEITACDKPAALENIVYFWIG